MLRFLRKKAAGKVYSREEELTRGLPADVDVALIEGPQDGACVCGDWVGAVTSISGDNPDFPSLSQAMTNGLFHTNCRHSLAPYRPAQHEAKALLCTQLAVDAMQRRRPEDRETPDTAGVGAESPSEEFERTYAAARVADVQGLHDRALTLSRTALKMLQQEDFFGESQATVEQALRARIRTIESQR